MILLTLDMHVVTKEKKSKLRRHVKGRKCLAKLTLVDVICDILVTSLQTLDLSESKKLVISSQRTINHLQLAAHLGVLLPDIVVHHVQRLSVPSTKYCNGVG